MQFMDGAMMAGASSAAGFLAGMAVKSTILLAIATGAAAAATRFSAATRHLVWMLSLGGCLLLPAAGLVLPGWEAPGLPHLVRQEAAETTVPADPAASPSGAAAETDLGVEASDKTTAAPKPVEPARTDGPGIGSILLAIWAIGAATVAAVLVAGSLSARGIVAGARAPEGDWPCIAAEAAAKAGVAPERFRLLICERDISPLAWGWSRPAVVLPRRADQWSEPRRLAVLIHELAHVRRGDCRSQALANLVCVLFWFQPLVWMAARRMLIERERACDDVVLAGGARASDYADQLLTVAREMGAGMRLAHAGVAMARRSQISGRLLAVLDPERRRGAPGRGTAWGAGLLLIGAAIVLGSAAPESGTVLAAGRAHELPARSGGSSAHAARWEMSGIRDEIARVNGEIARLFARRDHDAIAGLYSTDAALFAPQGMERHGRREVEELYREIAADGFRRLEIEQLELVRIDDRHVYETGLFCYSHESGDFDLRGRYLSVWRLEDGRWLVYRDISNS